MDKTFLMPVLILYLNISAGLHDKALIKWAKAAKAFSSPILVDFGYEPNADYFPWSKEGPSKYIAAYRHVVDIFRQQNVSNVYLYITPIWVRM